MHDPYAPLRDANGIYRGPPVITSLTFTTTQHNHTKRSIAPSEAPGQEEPMPSTAAPPPSAPASNGQGDDASQGEGEGSEGSGEGDDSSDDPELDETIVSFCSSLYDYVRWAEELCDTGPCQVVNRHRRGLFGGLGKAIMFGRTASRRASFGRGFATGASRALALGAAKAMKGMSYAGKILRPSPTTLAALKRAGLSSVFGFVGTGVAIGIGEGIRQAMESDDPIDDIFEKLAGNITQTFENDKKDMESSDFPQEFIDAYTYYTEMHKTQLLEDIRKRLEEARKMAVQAAEEVAQEGKILVASRAMGGGEFASSTTTQKPETTTTNMYERTADSIMMRLVAQAYPASRSQWARWALLIGSVGIAAGCMGFYASWASARGRGYKLQ